MIEGHLFQLGYVCDDIEEGIAQFRGRGMRHEPHILDTDVHGNGPQGHFVNKVRLCFIWIGEMQYELIQPITDPLGIYANAPSNGGPLRFHQVCYRVPDWTDFRARVDSQDLPMVMEWDFGPDQLKFLYLDGRSRFGHYLEYVWMSEEAWQQNRAM